MYTKYWTWVTWFTLLVFSVVLYIAYIWIANYIDIFIVYETIQMLFKTPQFYLVVALNFGCVFLFEAMYVYVQKEYFTQTGDFLRELARKKQEDDPTKLQKIEKLINKPKKTKGISPFNNFIEANLYFRSQREKITKRHSKGRQHPKQTSDSTAEPT